MRSVYNKMANTAILRVVVYLLLGLAMLIFPEIIISAIVYIVAAVFILMGAVKLVTYFKYRGEGGSYDLFSAIVAILVGIVLIIFTHQVASILPIFLGALLILVGIYQLAQQINAGKYGMRANFVQMLLSVLIIAGGVVGIVNPFGSLAVLFRVFGAFIVVMGVNELISLIALKREGNSGKAE